MHRFLHHRARPKSRRWNARRPASRLARPPHTRCSGQRTGAANLGNDRPGTPDRTSTRASVTFDLPAETDFASLLRSLVAVNQSSRSSRSSRHCATSICTSSRARTNEHFRYSALGRSAETSALARLRRWIDLWKPQHRAHHAHARADGVDGLRPRTLRGGRRASGTDGTGKSSCSRRMAALACRSFGNRRPRRRRRC